MYLRAKYTKYKMAKTKFSIWRYVICEICKKNGSNRPFLASRVADTIFPPPIEGLHRQLDNQCKDPMDNNKDCRVGQLTTHFLTSSQTLVWTEIDRLWMFRSTHKIPGPGMNNQIKKPWHNLLICSKVHDMPLKTKDTTETFYPRV